MSDVEIRVDSLSKLYAIGPRALRGQTIRESLAEMMLAMAATYPEYAGPASSSRIVQTSSGDFYGKGYQDVQNRLPTIAATVEELGWRPVVGMQDSLRRIFESYRLKVAEARSLIESAN